MFKNRNNEEIDVSYVSGQGNLFLKWGINNCGFGELYVSQNKENEKFNFSSEYMGRETVKAILCKMVDDGLFTDFEEEVKQVTVYENEQGQALSPFGEKDSMYFTMPFYMQLDSEDNSLVVMHFHAGQSVLAFWVKAQDMYAINDAVMLQYRQENAQFNSENDIAVEPFVPCTSVEQVELFAYGFHVKDKGWENSLVKVEKWDWQVREKVRK